MQLWIATKKHSVLGNLTRAASSDVHLRPKLSALAVEGLKDSPGDEPVYVMGDWEVRRAEVETNKDNIIALLDGNEAAIKTIPDSEATYVVDADGTVRKKRGS